MKRRSQFVGILTSAAVLFLFMALVGSPAQLQAQSIQVLSANPPTAEQGTVNLNVLIKGKGFKKGALAKFLVTGTTDTGGVRVNSTSFVSSTDLTANIDVADAAVLSKYDIQVMNSDGRGGKGTELFSVTKKQTSTFCSPTPILTAANACYLVGVSGCLDTSFGTDGMVITNTSGVTPYRYDIDRANSVALDSQGRIIAVGVTKALPDSTTDYSEKTAIVRHLPDGRLDATFGNGGIVIVPESAGCCIQANLAIQPDDKILVSGSNPMYIRRLNAVDGSPDLSFGNGTGRADLWPQDSVRGIALQSDGKIAVALDGTAKNRSAWRIARLNADGSADTSFAGSGMKQLATQGTAYSVAIQKIMVGSTPEERIVVAGAGSASGFSTDFTIKRFLPNGGTDTSFGIGGTVQTDFCQSSGIRDIKVDSLNRIVAGGTSDKYFALARYSPNGQPDMTFGNAGRVMTSIFEYHADDYGTDYVYGVVIQGDGKIVLSGDGLKYEHAVLARYNSDGTLDPNFGQGGVMAVYTGSAGKKAAITPDGRILQAGSFADVNTGYYFAVLRFWP